MEATTSPPATRVCNKCQKRKSVTLFHMRGGKRLRHRQCKKCRNALHHASYDKARVKNAHLKRNYGIDQNDWNSIWNQQGRKCAICGRPPKVSETRMATDHCHTTGQVRGIICPPCNRAIGVLGDNKEGLERALHYLSRGSYRLSWDGYFLRQAQLIATRSKDRSTQVGAVLVKDKRILSTGYNGMPRGVDDKVVERLIRPHKLLFMEHAERNCFYNCVYYGIPSDGADLYIWPLPPCVDCARAIIQCGVRRVITAGEAPARWADSVSIGLSMFKESGVVFETVEL